MKQFRKIDIPDRINNTFQDNCGEVFDVLTKISFLDGNVVKTSLSSGVNEVQHKLGREYVGWVLIDSTQSSIVSHAQKGSRSNKNIYVNASADTVATFWVF